MPETDDESSSPPEFQEFSNLLINAQRIADKTGKSHFFTWKGYHACVSSEIPKFTTSELHRRYKLAMQSIKKGQPDFFTSTQMSSASGRSSSSSSSSSRESTSILSEENQPSSSSQELTQIPETQLPGKFTSEIKNYKIFVVHTM